MGTYKKKKAIDNTVRLVGLLIYILSQLKGRRAKFGELNDHGKGVNELVS